MESSEKIRYGHRYNKYSSYLKDKYGEKVYKLPINIPATCPNRDGTKGTGGCIFCSEIGAGFESHSSSVSVAEQVRMNMAKISKGYGARKFIIYFQNYSNTYVEWTVLERGIVDACEASMGSAVEVCISTRPDCLTGEMAESLLKLCEGLHVNLTFELGLQSTSLYTLEKIRRGHGLGEFIECALMLSGMSIRYTVHMIEGFPWESVSNSVENANILTALKAPEIKIHSLYILRDTELGRMYERGEIEPISVDEYVMRVVEFIRHTSPDAVFQRFLGRAPQDQTLFCNWGMSWFRVLDMIEARLEELDAFQGDMCGHHASYGSRDTAKFQA
jgi:uncharacterized protein